MAVKDESLHRATEDFILPKPRKYYQTIIYNSHWQLRSLISSPEPNILYYSSGSDITALNTSTREREILYTVAFAPRCLTASKDYVCIGGENGDYVAISLKEKRALSELPSSLDADADARLPLEFDLASSHRTTLRESLRRTRNQAVTAKAIKVGKEIVNCITLWAPNPEASDRAYKIPISVIANNDRSVTVMDLQKSETLQKLIFPDFVNRSVMSPNGVLLATISDDPYLYIHQKQPLQKSKKESWKPGSEVASDDEWSLLCAVQIEGQRPEERSDMRGSFAVCFSNTGRYLAVATQYGLISVFDVETITEKDSLRAVFTTSRPSTERDCGGAVRAMEFSPAPFDLLAWTESTGRVGIADMRTSYFTRQLLIMDHNEENIEKIHITDKSRRDTVLDPRLRTFQTEHTSNSATPDYLGLDFDGRQIRHLSRELENRQQVPLTVEELEVLQAHRIARRQRDNAAAAQEALNDATNISRWVRMNTESADRRTAPSFRNFIAERNQDRERRGQSQLVPRRRSSVMLLAENLASEREQQREVQDDTEAGTSATRDRSVTDEPEARMLRQQRENARMARERQDNSTTESVNNPWAEIDALYRTRYSEDPPPERSTRLRIELEDDDRRDFAHRLRQPWRFLGDETTSLVQEPRVAPSSAASRPGHVETMGLCWSVDGRILYIGGSNGIYEYHVNVTGRKMFPDLVLR